MRFADPRGGLNDADRWSVGSGPAAPLSTFDCLARSGPPDHRLIAIQPPAAARRDNADAVSSLRLLGSGVPCGSAAA